MSQTSFQRSFHEKFTQWHEFLLGLERVLRHGDRDDREDALDAWGPIAYAVLEEGAAGAATICTAIGVSLPIREDDRPN